tara:strand:+ start:123 stop:371 length:249 start_codon:yes stop_codon:yes gene_type:complete
MRTSKSSEVAVFDTLWPILRSVVTRDNLTAILGAAMQEGEWGWESFEDIKTKRDLLKFIVEIKEQLDEEYEDDESVRFVLRK